MRQLLRISWDIWTHQNGYKHGSDGPDQQQLKERLQEEIEDEYNYGLDSLLPRNYHWLDKPLADMLKLNPATQQQWLSSIANARERYHNQQTADPTFKSTPHRMHRSRIHPRQEETMKILMVVTMCG